MSSKVKIFYIFFTEYKTQSANKTEEQLSKWYIHIFARSCFMKNDFVNDLVSLIKCQGQLKWQWVLE